MGIKILESQNMALLGKKVGSYWNKKIVGKTDEGNIFPKNGFHEGKSYKTCIKGWKIITKTREYLKLGFNWRVGKGHHIDAWDCKWIPEPLEGERPMKPVNCEASEVQHFIKNGQ